MSNCYSIDIIGFFLIIKLLVQFKPLIIMPTRILEIEYTVDYMCAVFVIV